MNYFFIYYFSLAFLLTNLIEFFPLTIIIKKSIKEKLVALVLINAMTLPVLWILTIIFYNQYVVVTILLELLVIIVETGLIKISLNQKLRDSFKAALVMNFLSATIGSAILIFLF